MLDPLPQPSENAKHSLAMPRKGKKTPKRRPDPSSPEAIISAYMSKKSRSFWDRMTKEERRAHTERARARRWPKPMLAVRSDEPEEGDS